MNGDPSIFLAFCKGDKEAESFITLWHSFNQEVDDIVDLPDFTPGRLLRCYVLANDLYSHPFYLRHWQRLQFPILQATNAFAVATTWEVDGASWKRRWADVLRHSGGVVHEAVALIVGGYENLEATTASFLAACYVNHADRYGVPE